MQIVIDIPRDVYESIISGNFDTDGYFKMNLRNTFRNGTPLTKGHGRMGDLDALEAEMINGIKAGNYEEGYEEYAHINNMDDCVECVRYADTIIEADKAESEDARPKQTDESCLDFNGVGLGDEVVGDYGAKGVVVGIDTTKGEILLSLLMRNYKVPQLVRASNYKTKTGRHFPQIIEVLEQITESED